MTAPTTETAPQPTRSGTGLQRKAGPLPVWGWVVLGIVGVGGYIWWRRRQGAATPTAGDGGAVSSAVTAIPIPTGNVISTKQYADLLKSNADLWETIHDLQGDESKEQKADRDEDKDKGTDREEARESDREKARERDEDRETDREKARERRPKKKRTRKKKVTRRA